MSDDIDDITLMDASETWQDAVRKYGVDGLFGEQLEVFGEEGKIGLKYMEKVSRELRKVLETTGSEREVLEAMVDASKFNLFLTIVSMVHFLASEDSTMMDGLDDFMKEEVNEKLEKFLESMEDVYFRKFIETLVSSAVLTGAGIAIDEGFAALKDE